jgi:hypothetical protein
MPAAVAHALFDALLSRLVCLQRIMQFVSHYGLELCFTSGCVSNSKRLAAAMIWWVGSLHFHS